MGLIGQTFWARSDENIFGLQSDKFLPRGKIHVIHDYVLTKYCFMKIVDYLNMTAKLG